MIGRNHRQRLRYQKLYAVNNITAQKKQHDPKCCDESVFYQAGEEKLPEEKAEPDDEKVSSMSKIPSKTAEKKTTTMQRSYIPRKFSLKKTKSILSIGSSRKSPSLKQKRVGVGIENEDNEVMDEQTELVVQHRTRRRTISIIHSNIDRVDEPLSGFCSFVIVGLSWLLVFLFFPFSLCFCLRIIREYERAVMFRIGRLVDGGTRGPGLFFVLPCVDSYKKIDLRVVSFDVPPQEILSKDSVTVTVDAVVYFHISKPAISVTNVNDASFSTKLLAQTTLRNILGTKTLAEMLSERDAIAFIIQKILDDGTDPWGVKVDRVDVKDIRLPHQLMRAMAAEAEAARDARARIIAAEGEYKASNALFEAATTIRHSRTALQLRYLQTLSSIAAEHNSTIVFPFPMSLMSSYGNGVEKKKE